MALRVDYFLGETFSNLRRNLLMTLAAISTVAVSLFLLGGVMVMGEIVNKTVGGWESLIEVNVFLREEVTPEQQKDLQSSILGMPEVSKAEYISKEMAFEEYKKMFEDSPAVYENVDPSALPALYRIKLRNPNTA
ncbi:MAG: cell division protein FtsX, partial [Acidimicrobiia bacterium]